MTELEKARQAIDEIDRDMAHLFEKRLDAVCVIAEYKKEHGIPVEDAAREDVVLRNDAEHIVNDEYRALYANFLRAVMDLSKDYQHRLHDD